jgi:Sel1 repeat
MKGGSKDFTLAKPGDSDVPGMANAMPRCSTCAVVIAWITIMGSSLFAQTNSAPLPISNFPNLASIRAEASGGQALAQTKLGDYHLARGDMTNAFAWYLKAAEQGNAQAQLSVAACYLHGQGVAQDSQEAMRWQRLAAVRPSPKSTEKVLLAQAKAPGPTVRETTAPPAPPMPPIPPRGRIQEIPGVTPTLEEVIAVPAPSPLAEPTFVRSQLPRISALSPAQPELEDVQLKVRPAE